MPKLIVLSGKMGCGKDTLIRHMAKHMEYGRAECKQPLHEATMKLFGIGSSTYWEIYEDRKRKETPNTLFSVTTKSAGKLKALLGELKYKGDVWATGMVPLTIRESMIYTSELVMKPMFGQDVFGQRRAKMLTGSDNLIYYDSSYGFEAELQPAIDKLGQQNILGVRILGRDTGGADSRSMLPDGLLENTVDIWNGDDISLEHFLKEGEKVILNWLGG